MWGKLRFLLYNIKNFIVQNMAKYTQKQIDKYNRQKYISEMDKIAKNLFRMFRDQNINSNEFKTKTLLLILKLQERDEIRFDGEYLNKMKEYINQICFKLQNQEFNDIIFDDMREIEMGNLNRLQKMKNNNSYKKDKHKPKISQEY
ncbi:conserved hypothetical protein [Sulfurovum sp. enrichment culture clone C5]|uniref:Uncharacterized protein n=1 Tax=Sulfurovum sp. enrichment culture clone C5 TaxID=497650 RepID=A0A0S4XLH2_9BACT|nr:conserved hypothetical protein [Sulfurovum sp. enrichment culture clone C5]